MKRIIAIMLTLVLIVALVGCGSNKRQPIQLTLSTEDSEAILNAAGVWLPDPETAPGANSVVKWLGWFDPFQNYSEDEIVQTGYWTFQQRYGGSLSYEETTYEDFTDKLALDITSGTPPDLTLIGISQIHVFPMPCVKGTYQPVDKYIDYENDPLWREMKDAAEYFALGDRHFGIVTDLAFKDVVPYNRRVIEEYGFDDPAQLYANDEWTWDVVTEMALDFSDPDDDRFAFDGWYVPNACVEQSTGHYLIEKDENGHYYSNIDDPLIEIAENLVYSWVKDDLFYREGTDYWANRNEAQYGAGVKDGKCLFWICDISGFRGPVDEMSAIWGDITAGELMFVPLPRHKEGDGIYYLSANPDGAMLVNDAPNPDGAMLLVQCLRFKIIDPNVVSIDKKQLKEIYLWSDEMLDMYDHCVELVEANPRIFNTGAINDNLRTAYDQLDWNIRRSGASQTWAQLRESYAEQMDYYCEEMNDIIDDYINGNG